MDTSLLTNLIFDASAALKAASVATKTPQPQVVSPQTFRINTPPKDAPISVNPTLTQPQQFAEILTQSSAKQTPFNLKPKNNLQAFLPSDQKIENKDCLLMQTELLLNPNLLNTTTEQVVLSQSAQPLSDLMQKPVA